MILWKSSQYGFVPVPKGPLRVIILFLGRQDWLREGEEGESEVGKPVLVLLHVGVTLHQLVKLKSNEAGDEGGGGGDGRDDSSSDALAGQPIRCLDAIVGCTRVAE